MKKTKNNTSFVNIGASSLLVIFVVLCFVTFATLSLSSAHHNYTFSTKAADHKTDYYNACNRANEVLDIIDTALSEASLDELDASASPLLADIALQINTTCETPYVSYQVPLNDTQTLDVCLSITEDADTFYKIQKWQVVNTQDWTPDDSVELMPGK